jgi:hypothetical protein
MSPLAITLASFRLAPIQLQGLGHPSSSHSSVIDGSLRGHGEIEHGPELSTSYEIYREGINIPFNLTPLRKELKNNPISLSHSRVNVAVNAKILKLSPLFLHFLKNIKKTDDVNLNFFPAERGTEELAADNMLRSIFPRSKVYTTTSYENFMQEMSIQDLALCPFPFGNTNGIIDCLYLGLPTFILRGRQLCSAPERHILERVGLPNFVFDDYNQLKVAIENYIYDEEYRSQKRKEFQEKSREFVMKNDIQKAQEYEGRVTIDWMQSHVDNFQKKR